MSATNLCYLVCALPRSGSSAFCEALACTGRAGVPTEYFLPRNFPLWRQRLGLPAESPVADYVAQVRARTASPNGVFGAKIMRRHFLELVSSLQPPSPLPAPELLANHLPGLRYIWMSRRDVVRQAVSHVIAEQTGHWSARKARKVDALADPVYDFAAIDNRVKNIRKHDRDWGAFFSTLPEAPIRIIYEDYIVEQPTAIRAVLETLGIAADGELFQRPLAYEKQSSRLNQTWLDRYLAGEGAKETDAT